MPIKSARTNTRGEFQVMYVVIIAIVGLLLLSIIIGSVYQKTRTKLEIQNCKNSISVHNSVNLATQGDFISTIKCPTRDITVSTKNQEKAREVIAEDMHRCWYEWNKGEGKYFSGEGVFCHICSVYTFSDSEPIYGLATYLSTTKIPTTFIGDDPRLSYTDYLATFRTPQSEDAFSHIPQNTRASLSAVDVIDTSKQYSTVIIYSTDKTTYRKLFEDGGDFSSVGTTSVQGVGVVSTGTGVFALATGSSAALAGTAVLGLTPAGWIVIGAGALTIGGVALYESVLKDNAPQHVAMIKLRPYNSDDLRKMGCTQLPVSQVSAKDVPRG